MDLIVLTSFASAFLVLIICIFIFGKKSKQTDQSNQIQSNVAEGVPRRAQIARNQRNRLRNVGTRNAPVEDDPQEPVRPSNSREISDEKMGTKKRAKLEAKAEKRIFREQEIKAKEEKKAREDKQEEEKTKIKEKEAEEERKLLELERLAKEEKERKEYEEYLKIKATFSVEEEGFEEGIDSEKENLLAEFKQFIRDNKVVVLEDLANHFKLKTQNVIDRITDLQTNDSLTGVIDDRGKFIYICENELQAVAKFIKQRGRLSIADLAERSNNLINLTSGM